jgi:hypothetical protein
MVGQYLYKRDEKKRARASVASSARDEEDRVDVKDDKAVGEIVEHVEERK